MDELKKVFLDAGVPENEIKTVWDKLGLKKAEDIVLFTSPDDFAEAGVQEKYARRYLAKYANDCLKAQQAEMDRQHEVEKARAVAEEKARLASAEAEAQRAADEAQAEKKKRDAEITVLSEAYKDNDSWIEALRREGILEFEERTYIAGIKAVLAANIGVFAAVPNLAKMINDYALENAKPVPRLYYDLQKILTMREYGLVIAASADANYNGVPIYATAQDMSDLIQRMLNDLVPKIIDAAKAVARWYSMCSSQSVSEYFMKQIRDGVGGMQYPSPAPIHEAGQNLRLSINRTFAGNGIQKALAICNEYNTFANVLSDPELPKAVGAIDRDAVLTKLGFDANAAVVRSEKHIINFVLNVINSEKCTDADELKYCMELYGLACQIDWSGLTNNPEDADLVKRTYQTNQPLSGLTQTVLTGIGSVGQAGGIGIECMNGQKADIAVRGE